MCRTEYLLGSWMHTITTITRIAQQNKIQRSGEGETFGLLGFFFPLSITVAAQVRQLGEHKSVHRDLNVAFGKWEFSPLDLQNLFPTNEGSAHI
ncbi:hypothetical protein Ahy_B06g083374 isoform D [Arachis hypogaea]|uniref:Uncharacterized protein n=1 Tax=Arachis hypogaea TaxID=3818 RepID=A0A444YPZ2_ARAHY|nr:hypothetical protein Ahy_B06g083374 isoform D [Arachis hypogaea]